MKSALPRLAVIAGLWAALCVSSALGQTIRFRSTAASADADAASSPFVPETKAASSPSGDCGMGCGVGCETGCGCDTGCGKGCGCADCDECPGYGLELWSGVEAYHNLTDGFFQRNAGVVFGGNVGVPLPKLRDYGIGAQFGAGYHTGDFDGRFLNDGFDTTETVQAQQELFLTAGLFRHAFCGEGFFSHFNMGIAYDWMMTSEFGQFAQSPTLGQWRGQIGYALNACNEIGVWGTLRDLGSQKDGHLISFQEQLFQQYPVHYRAMSQVNFFWHHNFNCGANMWLTFGIPEHTRLALDSDGNVVGDGSLYEYTLSAAFNVPISNTLALYANGTYMRPSATASGTASTEDGYSIGFGLAIYPGGNARTKSVAGSCWSPVLPVADNGSFLVNSDILSAR